MGTENKFFLYKGKPLVRCGNTIYYGSMGDKYVVMMQIMGSEKFEDVDVSNKVSIKLIMTDESKSPLERIVKSSEKSGLYNAMDIAAVWLEDALKK